MANTIGFARTAVPAGTTLFLQQVTVTPKGCEIFRAFVPRKNSAPGDTSPEALKDVTKLLKGSPEVDLALRGRPRHDGALRSLVTDEGTAAENLGKRVALALHGAEDKVTVQVL